MYKQFSIVLVIVCIVFAIILFLIPVSSRRLTPADEEYVEDVCLMADRFGSNQGTTVKKLGWPFTTKLTYDSTCLRKPDKQFPIGYILDAAIGTTLGLITVQGYRKLYSRKM